MPLPRPLAAIERASGSVRESCLSGRANLLLDSSLTAIQTIPRLGIIRFIIARLVETTQRLGIRRLLLTPLALATQRLGIERLDKTPLVTPTQRLGLTRFVMSQLE